jgi:hypothetical protein
MTKKDIFGQASHGAQPSQQQMVGRAIAGYFRKYQKKWPKYRKMAKIVKMAKNGQKYGAASNKIDGRYIARHFRGPEVKSRKWPGGKKWARNCHNETGLKS